MKQTLLHFPDTFSIASFVLKFEIAPAEVNSQNQTLSAFLSEDLVSIACADYNASLMSMAA